MNNLGKNISRYLPASRNPLSLFPLSLEEVLQMDTLPKIHVDNELIDIEEISESLQFVYEEY